MRTPRAFSFALVAVVAIVLAVAVADGQDKQKPDKKSDLNVSGKWTMTLDMSMGQATPSLELTQDGEKIAGNYTGRYGTFPLQGTLKDRAIAFSFTMGAEGQSVVMTFAGDVAADGQSMKGTASLGDMGDATWSAKRAQ